MDPGVYRDPKETAFLQTLNNTKISFNIIKHFSDEASKKDANKHIVVNLQYTMKYLYEQVERMEREWSAYIAAKDPGTPLNSTLSGMKGLTHEEAMEILRKRQNK
jgi:hypothetical protein